MKIDPNILQPSGRSVVILPDGCSLVLKTELDEEANQTPPWEQSDGHGPVSAWVRRGKASGEMVLMREGSAYRYYDFKAALALAKKDGWGLSEGALKNLAKKLGRAPTKAEITVQAVIDDFTFLEDWAKGNWEYLYLSAELRDARRQVIASDSRGGIDGWTDYARQTLADMGEGLIAQHEKECAEKAYWASRGVETVGTANP